MKEANNNIPQHWEIKKLGEQSNLITKGASPRWQGFEYISDETQLLFVTSENVRENFIDVNNPKYLNLDFNTIQKRSILKKGDVLFNLVGASIGRAAIFNLDKISNINQAVAIIRLKETLNNKYLSFFLNSEVAKHKYLSNIVDVARANISLTDTANIEIPLPPLPEQVAIVNKIEELFSELENGKEQLLTAQRQLKIYRQSLLKAAFEGRLTNEKVKAGELPEGWKQLKLKDITLDKDGLRRGPFGSAIKKEFFVPTGYKVYEQGNAINNDPYRGRYYINEAKYKELINFKVLPYDLIVSCSGVTLGRICEIPPDGKAGIINQALLRIRLRKEIIMNKYFILNFRGAFFQRKIFYQSQGTAMPNLVGIKDFKEIDMLIPPLPVQQAIVEILESKLTVCDKLEETISHSLEQTETLRQSILKKAFEGKLYLD